MDEEDPWADAPPSPKPDISPTRRAAAAHPSPLVPLIKEDQAGPSSPPGLAGPSIPPPSAAVKTVSGEDASFDDFEDFDEPGAAAGPSQVGGAADDADGFGDFGDYEEGEGGGELDQGSAGAGVVDEPGIIEERWQSLRLRPFPPRSELLDQLSDLLSPWLASGSSSSGRGRMTDEPVRVVGGLRQLLVSPESQEAYVQLNTPPQLKPLDWTRSRVRREHLISMGVPVNLDEVDSHRLTALPPLRITTSGPSAPPPRPRASSVDPARRSVDVKGKRREVVNGTSNGSGGSVPSTAIPGRNGSAPSGSGLASGSGRGAKYGLGPRPELDMAKAEELCGLEEDQLALLPLPTLKAMQEELAGTSAQASAVLAWLLQLKDAQAQDSATYNGMISELIANAAKAKSAQQTGSGGVFRRASGRQRPQTGSGGVTPRSGTPAFR